MAKTKLLICDFDKPGDWNFKTGDIIKAVDENTLFGPRMIPPKFRTVYIDGPVSRHKHYGSRDRQLPVAKAAFANPRMLIKLSKITAPDVVRNARFKYTDENGVEQKDRA